MKFWAMTIMRLGGKLEKLADSIDETVGKLALDLSADTLKQYYKIMEYNDVKRRVVNLKVMRDRMLDRLPEDEREIVLCYAAGKAMQEIADTRGVSKSSISRKIHTALYKCIRVLDTLGFDTSRLDAEYADIPLVQRTLKKLQRSHFGKKEDGAKMPIAYFASSFPETRSEERRVGKECRRGG